KTLDSIEKRSLDRQFLIERVIQHIELTAVSTVLVIAIAIPLGIMLTRPTMRRATPLVLAIVNIGQAVPSIGVLVLLALTFGIGFRYAVIALVLYSFLPVLRNTMAGLQRVERSLIDAGRGMGMTKRLVLTKVELPLALPVMMAGIRTALIINVGTATLATFTNAHGLGDVIDAGLKLDRRPVLITGAVLVGVLALSIDWLAGLAERFLRPKGL
ncbi:MAG: ABC transporter permease, partial [Pseudonocardiales bacterium]